jgi:membrane-associated phospholipid phosphatase
LLYGAATLTGISRVYDHKHWASDVLLGAGIGTVSGWLVSRHLDHKP